MTKFKIHITLVIFFVLNIIVCPQDVILRIPKTSINKSAEAFVKAKYLSYGSVDDGNFVEYYSLKPKSAEISLQQGNVFSLTLNVDFNANFRYLMFDFEINQNANIVLVGTIQMQSTENGYKVILHPVSINSNLSGTLGNVLNFASSGILSHYNEIAINTSQFYLPNILSEYFTATEPVLTTDENGITLSLILKEGVRYITALNKVNQSEIIGSIENEEGANNYVSYDSPKTFDWNTGETHKIQTPLPLLDASNGKNKYKNWYDPLLQVMDEIYPRRIQVLVGTNDDIYTANFDQAQHVQLSNSLEGNLTGGTVTYESTTASSFNDYDYSYSINQVQHPINTTVPNGTLGHNWNFVNWSDENTSPSRNIILNSDVNLTANYKGHLLSNNSTSFSTIGQRKIVAEPFTSNRHLVYESQGFVWYSKSTDNGFTWSPERKMSEEGAQARGASIAVNNGNIYILYQSDHDTYNNPWPTLILRKLSSDGWVRGKKEVYDLGNSYTYNTMSVLTTYSNYILVVFKPNATSGLLGREFLDNNSNFSLCTLTNVLIFSGTTQYSVNPTLTVKYVLPNRRYMLAYQESYSTIYCKEWDVATDLSNLTTTNLTSGSPYPLNSSPSIVSFGTGARVCWIGGSYSQYSAVVFRDTDPASTRFWAFGFYASSPSINATDYNTAYFIGWKENGTGFKIVDNHLSSSYMKTLTGLQGNAIQLSSGSNADVMYAMTYNNTTPPLSLLNPSNSLGSYYRITNKESAVSNIASGRAGVVTKDQAQFYFMLGDIEVDGEKIRFKELSDTLSIPSKEILNTVVESKPFELKANSTFTYSVEYGVTDSATAAHVLQNDENVKFKVEIVDATSNQVINTFDNVSYSKAFLQSYSSIAYQVNTEAIGSMAVKLRLVADNSGNAAYTIVDRFVEDNVIAKKGYKVINLKEDIQIKDYALAQNYPNPFNPVTTINYQLPKDGMVTLKIYDILGNEVKMLVNEQKEKGRYTVQFDASTLASGIYVYQIKANDYVATKKMMLLK